MNSTPTIRVAGLMKSYGDLEALRSVDFEVAPGSIFATISMAGQFADVDEILTGRENLVLIARLRHLDTLGRIADNLLARFSLTDAEGRRVATYSGGMRRRLRRSRKQSGGEHGTWPYLRQPCGALLSAAIRSVAP